MHSFIRLTCGREPSIVYIPAVGHVTDDERKLCISNSVPQMVFGIVKVQMDFRIVAGLIILKSICGIE